MEYRESTLLSALQGRRPHRPPCPNARGLPRSSTAMAAIPTTLARTRTGIAAFAALGGSTSSKNGTGSPSSLWNGPSGQSPPPMPSAIPSTARKPIETGRTRSRWRVMAHHQICASVDSPTTDHAAWKSRKDLARQRNSDHPTVSGSRLVTLPPRWRRRTSGGATGRRPLAAGSDQGRNSRPRARPASGRQPT